MDISVNQLIVFIAVTSTLAIYVIYRLYRTARNLPDIDDKNAPSD